MPREIAYVALGANLGDRAGNIAEAVRLLRDTPGIIVRKQSSLIENPAVGGPPDSPAFLNGVIELQTTLTPHALLAQLLEIERALGREHRTKWEPRTIDLDLILYGAQIIDKADLTVPHPLMHQRRFVLEPLAQIAPHVVHPTTGKSIRSLLIDIFPAV
jgi:2-amino-4-hydroxy-6-hydroxymethyldihydropteridine diphosphokinase